MATSELEILALVPQKFWPLGPRKFDSRILEVRLSALKVSALRVLSLDVLELNV